MDRNQQIADNLRRVEERIERACGRAGRPRESVRLIAVVKMRPLDEVRTLHALGPAAFAENRIQDARPRIAEMPPGIEWHFIGHLQTNKAKYLPGLFSWVHSADRFEVVEALDKAWQKHPALPPLRLLLQFNISGETQKHGAEADEAAALVRRASALERVRVEGLMCMAPFVDDPEEARPVFCGLRSLRNTIEGQTGIALPQLSMGMTNDFEVAIEEGATMVRIGSALFE